MPAVNLIVCSHRGPFYYQRTRGKLVAQQGAGGLVNAVGPVMARFGGTWIASALTDADSELAANPDGINEGGFTLKFLDLPPDVHQRHYEIVCNQNLWFVFHYLFDLPNTPRFDREFVGAWDAYREVNRIYAEALPRTEGGDAILIEDFHLMLVAEHVRRTDIGTPLVYFHHTPWAEPDYFSLLPTAVVEEILRGMLAHDVVGFHTTRWARAFLECCDRLLPGADARNDRVAWEGREVRVLVAPAPLGAEQVSSRAADPGVARWRERLEEMRAGRLMLLRVDRVELSKNVLRGFQAFEALLERRPSLAKEIWFLALVYPSRPRVTEYRRYLGSCLNVAQRINRRFGIGPDDGPLGLYVQDDYHRSLAGMQLFDALLVNPVFDGLNLVAKEACYLNERDGTLVLSRNAGVFDELGEYAVAVNPFDVTETAAAIETALEMPKDERAKRATELRRAVTTGTPEGWIRGQLEAAGIRMAR